MSKDREQLEALWAAAEGKCFYCDKPTWLPARGVDRQRGLGPTARMATREHLESRNVGDPLHKGSRLVLACRRCNQARANAEQRATPREVRRRRSTPAAYGFVGLRHALSTDPNYLQGGGA